MEILITGGTGLIGSRFIHKFHQQHKFTVLSRQPKKAIATLPAGVRTVSSLKEIKNFAIFDAVINLAGEPIVGKRWTEIQKSKICESRWDLTSQIVSRIKACPSPPAVLISGSAIGYYGRQGETPVTERTHTVHDEFTHRVCKKWEDIALDAGSAQTRVCLLRTGVVLNADEGALPKMALPFKFGLGGKIGNGKQYLSWVHIEDEINAISYLLDNPRCQGAYNLTAPEPVTNAEFTDQLARALHRPALFTVPPFVMKLALGEASDMLLYGQKVLPERLLEDGFTFQFSTIKEALKQEYQR